MPLFSFRNCFRKKALYPLHTIQVSSPKVEVPTYERKIIQIPAPPPVIPPPSPNYPILLSLVFGFFVLIWREKKQINNINK